MRLAIATVISLSLGLSGFILGHEIGSRRRSDPKTVLLAAGRGYYCPLQPSAQRCSDGDPVYTVQLCLGEVKDTQNERAHRYLSRPGRDHR